MPQPMHHRIAVGLHMAHNKTFAHAGIISDAIELHSLPSPQPPPRHHRSVTQEDSTITTSTISPSTFSFDRDTIETNLSVTPRDETFDKDECCYKRSRSYHGKGSDHSCANRCCTSRCYQHSMLSQILSLKTVPAVRCLVQTLCFAHFLCNFSMSSSILKLFVSQHLKLYEMCDGCVMWWMRSKTLDDQRNSQKLFCFHSLLYAWHKHRLELERS